MVHAVQNAVFLYLITFICISKKNAVISNIPYGLYIKYALKSNVTKAKSALVVPQVGHGMPNKALNIQGTSNRL